MARRRSVHNKARAGRKGAGTSAHEAVSAEIRRARLAAGLTQAQLAARLNTSPSWVAAAENGRRHLYVHDLPRIAGALDIDTLELLRRAMQAASSQE